MKHLQSGSIFSKDSPFSDFVENFEPITGESTCLKDNFSSFSSSEFCSLLENNKDAEIYMIGYGSTMCCLSTIIDGYHRGYKFTFVADASNAKQTVNLTSDTLHKSAIEILQAFCRTTSSKEIILYPQ